MSQSGAYALLLGLTPVVAGDVGAALRPHLEHPSVYRPGRARHVAGGGRSEEGDDGCNLSGVPGSPQRHTGTVLFVRVLIGLAGHGRGDLTGRHCVGRDAKVTKLEGSRLDQATEAVLGRVVGGRADPGLVLMDAGDRDNTA